MTRDASLFDDLSRQEQFETFIREHPDVWRLFVRFANDLWAAGRRRGSARNIVERIRWECQTSSQGKGDYKINDHCVPWFARKLIETDPKFKDFFELRTIQKA